MPYLCKTFNHKISDSSSNSWDYEKKTGEVITYNSCMSERKGYTDQFFADLKELLQQTNLTITFDDENNSFNVFDMDFLLRCVNSNTNDSYWTHPSYYTYCGVRPIIILPRVSDAIATNTTSINSNLEDCSYSYISNTSSNKANSNNSYHWINCNTSPNDEIKKQVNYAIKIYYNTNYIVCSYISFNGYEIPLFCFIQGEIVTTKQKAVYLCTCMNNYNPNQYHKIAIPSQNTDKTKYYDYLPDIKNYTKLDNIFDRIKYPSINILTKLLNNGNINDDVFLNKVTAFGGIISFDNVFDVSRINTDNLPAQILTRTVYTINENDYYCPGYSVIYYSSDSNANGRYIFKL